MKFPEFYKLVTGNSPFQWQMDVVDYLCANKWYESIATPPSTGKTSIIEMWYYALYHNITHSKRFVPLRLWYVVDRKIIVDGAYEAAKNLALKLNDEASSVGDIVKEYFGCDVPLRYGKIRGGLDRISKNQWLEGTSPVQPTVITSTIDQYGSRLLFRGYGISPKVRSIHAAMTGIDSLVILDEGHLSPSLKKVLNVVQSNFKLDQVPSTKVIELTATSNNDNQFPVKVQDDPRLATRLNAKKKITLVQTTKLISELIAQTKNLAKSNQVIAVICNTVVNAREVYNGLKNKKHDCVLLIGRIRQHERAILHKKYINQLLAGRDRSTAKKMIVIATQTIEVGANFDFDAMISQSAPLDCLVQRFGRVDRLGELGVTSGVIVHKNDKDYIYGDKTQETFEWLKSQYQDSFNISKVKLNQKYYATPNHLPNVTKSLLDHVLIHTHPVSQVNIDGFLHGVKLKADSDFQLIYRSEFTEEMLKEARKDNKLVLDWLNMRHFPKNQEILSLPIYCLSKKDASDNDSLVDVEENPKKTSQLCVRYRDGRVIEMSDIVPGDLVIVPCSYGQYDKFGWNPISDEPVSDVSDFHSNIVRIHPNWAPGFKLANYICKDTGQPDVNQIVSDLDNNLIPDWLSARSKWAKHIQRYVYQLSKSFYEITPDGEGIYFHLTSEKKKQKQQNLIEHNAIVGHNAQEFAQRLGLSQELIDILEFSGKCHDLGKADPRFQEQLYYPKPLTKTLLAKSKGYRHDSPKNYPLGWRHELQSLQIIMENDLGAGLTDIPLFHHLVASHHGWFRNFIPLTLDETFKPFEVNDWKSSQPYFDAYQEVDRNNFYTLNEKYGIWGLAFLETILRLADWKN